MSRFPRACQGRATGKELRDVRVALGLSGNACARLLAISEATLWRWEAEPERGLPLGPFQEGVLGRLEMLRRRNKVEEADRLREAFCDADPLHPIDVLLRQTTFDHSSVER